MKKMEKSHRTNEMAGVADPFTDVLDSQVEEVGRDKPR